MAIEVIPVKKGWFHVPTSEDDRPYLIGSRCDHCGFTTFPKATVCVSCMSEKTMREVPLSSSGKLDTFTLAMQGPAGFATPYIQAFVILHEGVRIFTLVEGSSNEFRDLKLGQEMELVIAKIKEDENGNEIIGWKFRPAMTGR